MRIFNKTLLGCMFFVSASLTVAPMAFAGTASGPVVSYAVTENGILMFALTVNNPTPPACNTVLGRFAVNLNSVAGKAWYATIITSWVTGKTIYVEGRGDCSVIADSEAVKNIYN